uniref:Uncharacterized protein n=1 Tax=Arundo donax TaxID=35708 RepID=A0A0A9DDB7_ARUDO
MRCRVTGELSKHRRALLPALSTVKAAS